MPVEKPRINRRTGKVTARTIRYKKIGEKYVAVKVPMKVPSIEAYLRQRKHIMDRNSNEIKANRVLFKEIKKYNSFIYNITKKRPVIKGQLQLNPDEIKSLKNYFNWLREKYKRVKNYLRVELVEEIEKAAEQFSKNNWAATNASLMGASRRITLRNKELSRINDFERGHSAFTENKLKKMREIDAGVIHESNNYLVALKDLLGRRYYNRVFLKGVIRRLAGLYNDYFKIAKAPGEREALKRIESSIRLLANARDNPDNIESQKRVWSAIDNLQKIKEDLIYKYVKK